MTAPLTCSICGGEEFREGAVLWPELVAEWQLNQAEVRYIDRQQGCACIGCNANLRVIALGNSVRAAMGTSLFLTEAVASGAFDDWKVLDINGADGISTELARLPGYVRADYPQFDMRNLPLADGMLDLVIHSDTLEHIEHPVLALEECRRVLRPGRRLCFTVPIIVGRKTRDRAGLPSSYHGDPAGLAADFVVHTEFGADVWTQVMQAGFSDVVLSQVEYPSGIAVSAWNSSAGGIAQAAPESVAAEAGIYDRDGLRTIHNHEFMSDPDFSAAYRRGVAAAGTDYSWQWRVHTGLWAAVTAAKLPGDFAEFGVNRGFLSSAIMQRLDWNSTGRRFFLFDTFTGIDSRYITPEDIAIGVVERNERDIASGFYTFDIDEVRRNFAQWPLARIIAGPVPETLPQLESEAICFVHIDMNCAAPEVAAAEYVWDLLVPGAIILLDDYAYTGYRSQKLAMDEFARSKGVAILSLPTGQGLIIKPPA